MASSGRIRCGSCSTPIWSSVPGCWFSPPLTRASCSDVPRRWQRRCSSPRSHSARATSSSSKAGPIIRCPCSAALHSRLRHYWPRPPRRRAFLSIVAPALLVLPLVASASEATHPTLRNRDALAAVVGLHRGDEVGFLVTDTAIPSMVSLQYGFGNPSRYNGIWMMHAVVGNELKGNRDPRIAAFGRQVVANTVVDFRCTPPKESSRNARGPAASMASTSSLSTRAIRNLRSC